MLSVKYKINGECLQATRLPHTLALLLVSTKRVLHTHNTEVRLCQLCEGM